MTAPAGQGPGAVTAERIELPGGYHFKRAHGRSHSMPLHAPNGARLADQRGWDLVYTHASQARFLAQVCGEIVAAAAAVRPDAAALAEARAEVERLRKLLDVPADLRAVMARASKGRAYVSGPPWFRTGSMLLVGSPDRHAGTIIADCDPMDIRHDQREADREVADGDDDAIVLAAAWNRLLAQAAAPHHGDTAAPLARGATGEDGDGR